MPHPDVDHGGQDPRAEIVDRPTAGNHGVAVDLARLPGMVRGHDEAELRDVDLHHERMGRLRARLSHGRLRGSR
ncbi:hypothetical protein [Geodermatophilus sp. DSM 45219]|uniref:hypothetical protein n=1 Tax=Geodermatophilus sp. DSM 45219 TaxID=1881103 RepID=UPI000B8782FB|nr:hypothetical protein [Geodermatophilus sp. DSM 45219]